MHLRLALCSGVEREPHIFHKRHCPCLPVEALTMTKEGRKYILIVKSSKLSVQKRVKGPCELHLLLFTFIVCITT